MLTPFAVAVLRPMVNKRATFDFAADFSSIGPAVSYPAAFSAANAPDVPTFRELGHADLAGDGWFAFDGPKGMPSPAVDAWSRAVAPALADPAVDEQVRRMGFRTERGAPAALAAGFAADVVRRKPSVAASGFTVEE